MSFRVPINTAQAPSTDAQQHKVIPRVPLGCTLSERKKLIQLRSGVQTLGISAAAGKVWVGEGLSETYSLVQLLSVATEVPHILISLVVTVG